MKLLFLANVPSPYRVDFYNELGKHCDLTVIFEKETSDGRDKSWLDFKFENFRGILLQGIRADGASAVCPDVLRYLKKGAYDQIVCTNFLTPTGMIAVTWMRLMGIPYYVEIDGGWAKNGKGFKEAVKRHFTKGAAGYFSTARESDRYLLCYGAETDKLIRYPFSSVYERDILQELPSRETKKRLREKLGMADRKIAMYVGRMLDLKGVDVLLHAAKSLNPDIDLYMVGGEPTDAYQKILDDAGVENVYFRPFQNKEGLAEYYQAADVFVMPTRGDVWGLVLNEAMGYGLPVVSTDRCIAALEMVAGQDTGMVVPVEDADALAAAVNTMLADALNLRRCSENALQVSRKYTLETMVARHLEVLGGTNT